MSCAGVGAFVKCPGRVRAVFDHVEPVTAGQEPDGLHIAGQAGVMHGHDGACLICNARGDGGGIDVSIRSDVRKHWRCAGVDDCVHRRAEGQRSGDHFHSRANVQRGQGEMQTGGTRVHRQRVWNIGVSAEFLFELGGARAGGEPAGPQCAYYFIDLFVADAGTVIGYLNCRLHLESPLVN